MRASSLETEEARMITAEIRGQSASRRKTSWLMLLRVARE
jgi:hypothetical protein